MSFNILLFCLKGCSETLSRRQKHVQFWRGQKNHKIIQSMLSTDFKIVKNCFFNYMVLNLGKCHFMFIRKSSELINDSELLNLNGLNLENSKEV